MLAAQGCALSHASFCSRAWSIQCCSAACLSTARCATPPANNADFSQCCHSQPWRPSAVSWATSSRHPPFKSCCRRSYSTGSHGALQQAAAAAAVMKVSVRRGTCVSPGTARVQRLQDSVQPPELAFLSAKAVASTQGQVRRSAQHDTACDLPATLCGALLSLRSRAQLWLHPRHRWTGVYGRDKELVSWRCGYASQSRARCPRCTMTASLKSPLHNTQAGMYTAQLLMMSWVLRYWHCLRGVWPGLDCSALQKVLHQAPTKTLCSCLSLHQRPQLCGIAAGTASLSLSFLRTAARHPTHQINPHWVCPCRLQPRRSPAACAAPAVGQWVACYPAQRLAAVSQEAG